MNIITTCNGKDDKLLMSRLSESFPMLKVQTFTSGFEGIIGQVNEDKYIDSHEEIKSLTDEEYDDLMESLYSIEKDIIPFSKEFPERTFVYIYVDSAGGVCSYEGFSVANGTIIVSHNQINEGHIPLLQTLFPAYNEWYFKPFTREFVK